MSKLLRSLATYIRDTANPDIHVVSGQDWSDEQGYTAPSAEPKAGSSEPVEPAGSVTSLGEPESGRIACFMDGIERKHVPLHVSMIPIVYGYVAAAIRVRGNDKHMSTHAYKSREGLFFPYRLVDPVGFQRARIDCIDTETDEKLLEEHPLILREAARVAISNARGRLENELVRAWLGDFAGSDQWLLVDGSLGGTLGGDFRKHESPNLVGVIKSHQTQYFSMEEQRKVLSLRAGERSWVFRPISRQRQAPVYSWYLRVRPNDGQDVYFGLIRVEVAANDRGLEMADEMSRWLLAERRPLSLPDSRWDKMFYPIRDCEQYLRSLAPSMTMLEASMIGATTHARTNAGGG